MALFDTTPQALGNKLNHAWRMSRESHPSEDLSELPPSKWLDRSIRLTLSLRSSLPKLFSGRWTRFAPCLAVVYAVARTGGPRASPDVACHGFPRHVSERIQIIGCSVIKVPWEGYQKPSSLCRQRGGSFYAPNLKIFLSFSYAWKFWTGNNQVLLQSQID